jgi:hypothetical protein
MFEDSRRPKLLAEAEQLARDTLTSEWELVKAVV